MRANPVSVDALISSVGTLTEASKAFGVSAPQVLSNWRRRGQVPADKVLIVEAVTGISRHRIRPDIFGPAPASQKVSAA